MGRHDEMVLDIGEDVDGYQVESFVARGGMAVVYKARDRRLGRPVALKLIAPELASDPTFRARFTRESELAASLDHPNVLPIYQAGEIDGMLYTVMRFVDGEDLDAVLKRRRRLTPSETVTVFTSVAAALDAAHARQLVHRDVKPGNILLTGTDDAHGMNLAARHVYLTDFGLTKRSADVTGLTTAGQFLGTIAYVAPEQIANQPVDHRADVYSLGCVLYHVLTGAPPFARNDYVAMMWAHISAPPPTLSSAAPDLPVAADAVLLSAMAKRPDARPDSCSALVGQLRDAFGLTREAPFRLADRAGRPVSGVLDRYAGEPVDESPTVSRDTPDEVCAPVQPHPRHNGGPIPSGGSPQGADPWPMAGTDRSPVRPVPSSGTPSLGHALVLRPPPVEPPASTPRTPPEQSGGGRRRPRPEPYSPPTLASHRRDPEPPPPGGRSLRTALIAGLVTFALLAAGAGLWLAGRDTDRPGTSAGTVPSVTTRASSSSAPSDVAPASVPRPTVAATVKVGDGPQGLVFAPNGRRAYVANSDARTVSVIDTEERRVVGTIPTRDQPQYLAMSPKGDRLYVSTHNDDGGGNTVVVVDAVKRTVVTRIPVEAGQESHPYALAVSPDGVLLYVPDHDRNVVLVIDTTINQLVMNLEVRPAPHWVAFAPGGGDRAYLANHESNLLTVVDTRTTAVTATIPVGKSPHSVVVTQDGARAFTANFDVDTSSVVDLRKRRTIATVPVGGDPRCVALSADGRHAYYAATGADTVTVVDTKTLKRTADVRVGGDPWVVAVSPDGRTAWVSNRDTDTVSVLSLVG
ncbi:protein kinase domain-containing protein [Cryptosporangium minutisporangium]|uniref:protein kinase domain-containing protein n=1 Tax=Cryptosporangium minutisporangium TaxID=113569 RepID=UPI0035F0E59D